MYEDLLKLGTKKTENETEMANNILTSQLNKLSKFVQGLKYIVEGKHILHLASLK